ncbi:MAG: ThiF family adenylyltransferase [bacterium]
MSGQHNSLTVIEGMDIPEDLPQASVLRLLPKDADEEYYRNRTDRNWGWITRNEQAMLQDAVVGIAGCGGMGGLLLPAFLRAGVGEVRTADCETFDVSNINRQFGAKRRTVGMSKALTTARDAREVTDDTTVVVYPQGIDETTVDHFLAGCDVVLDEIELLTLDARILLHERGRAEGVPLFNCNTVGFCTNLFLYTPQSMTMEEAVGFGYEEAKRLRASAGAGDTEAGRMIAEAILGAVVPDLPEYSPETAEANAAAFYRRIFEEGKAPIIATNPIMAAGFLANRVLLHLLRNSGVRRNIAHVPPMAGYMQFDAATMQAKVVSEGWVPRAVRR